MVQLYLSKDTWRTTYLRENLASLTQFLCSGFTSLDLHLLAIVPNPLTLVGLWFTYGTNLCCKLADHLLITALHDNVVLVRAGNREPSRDFLVNLVCVADSQL